MVIRVAPSGSVNCEISDFRLVVDPGPRERGNLVLKTSVALPLAPAAPEVITHAGEYEIQGVKVIGLDIEGESDAEELKTGYLVEADGVRLCFLGGLTREPGESFLERLGDVDVLFIAAGNGFIEPKKVAALVKELEPHIVVPVTDAAAKGLAEELGKKPEVVDRLVIKHKDMEGEEGTKLVWIKEK